MRTLAAEAVRRTSRASIKALPLQSIVHVVKSRPGSARAAAATAADAAAEADAVVSSVSSTTAYRRDPKPVATFCMRFAVVANLIYRSESMMS